MKHIVNLLLLSTSCTSYTFGLGNTFLGSETVRFNGNDISNNVIAREYSDHIKRIDAKDISQFKTVQLTKIVPQNFANILQARQNYLHKIIKKANIGYMQEISKLDKVCKMTKRDKEQNKRALLQSMQQYIQSMTDKWDENAEQNYMHHLLPKLNQSIEKELCDTECQKKYLMILAKLERKITAEEETNIDTKITAEEETLLQNMASIYEYFNNGQMGEMYELLKKVAHKDDAKIIQRIGELIAYYSCGKFRKCFGKSNEYFIFVGDNPDGTNATPSSPYTIENILPKCYFRFPTSITLTIPGNLNGHPVSISNKAFFRLFHINEKIVENLRLKIVLESGVYLPEGISSMFDDLMYDGNGWKLADIHIGKAFFPKNEWDMSYAFRNCKNLQKLVLNNVDTLHVCSMAEVFKGCRCLKELRIENFDTSNVYNMTSMFEACENLEQLNLSKFNTVHVKDMSRMFYDCKNLKTLDLSNFDMQNNAYITYMFAGCKNLIKLKIKQSTLNQLLKKDKNLFKDCSNLQVIYA